MSRLSMFLRVLVILSALASLVNHPAVSFAQSGPVMPRAISIDENTILRYAFTAISLLLV